MRGQLGGGASLELDVLLYLVGRGDDEWFGLGVTAYYTCTCSTRAPRGLRLPSKDPRDPYESLELGALSTESGDALTEVDREQQCCWRCCQCSQVGRDVDEYRLPHVWSWSGHGHGHGHAGLEPEQTLANASPRWPKLAYVRVTVHPMLAGSGSGSGLMEWRVRSVELCLSRLGSNNVCNRVSSFNHSSPSPERMLGLRQASKTRWRPTHYQPCSITPMHLRCERARPRPAPRATQTHPPQNDSHINLTQPCT